MSPDIALSLIAARASTPTTPNEKEKENSPIHKSPSSTDITGSGGTITSSGGESSSPSASSSRSSSSTNLFSLLSLKSFFTLPGPGLSSGTVKKMPAFLMVVTTALLFTCGGNFIPVVNAGAIPTSTATTTGYTTSAPVYTHSHNHNQGHGPLHPQTHTLSPRDGNGGAGANGGNPPPQPGPIAWNTPCTHPGEEGIWNCMATTWQRCVQGRWSVIMRSEQTGADEPDDTVCVPSGISKDVKFVRRAEAASMSSGAGSGTETGSGSTSGGGQGDSAGGDGMGGSGSGTDGTETKWAGGAYGSPRYWSAAEGVMLRGNRSSTRDRMVFVLGVAGVVGVVLGLPPVV